MIGPVYFALKAGESIHGLLASIGSHERVRVYVVTVASPAEHADRWPEWPRIVKLPIEVNDVMSHRRASGQVCK